MGEVGGVDEIESLRIELAEIGRSIRSSFRSHASSFRSAIDVDNNEGHHALQWTQIQRLPTFERITSALFDVNKLGAQERHLFIEKLLEHIENDNLRLLQKLRNRIDK
ncbi:ABC transporter G family member [Arachis hypogaea]|nr:ABC transporter G family member [Arachis hypogaea]